MVMGEVWSLMTGIISGRFSPRIVWESLTMYQNVDEIVELSLVFLKHFSSVEF